RFMKLERKIHGATLGFSMVASILTTIFFTYKFNPALTFVIPMGILSLYFFLFIGQFFEHKRQKV
ncbi:MAG: hypothetical protein KDK36_18780, partial [Leptospiraceae bacterium]|nr:hypothetical protein [Leptospiraceae bacterium]